MANYTGKYSYSEMKISKFDANLAYTINFQSGLQNENLNILKNKIITSTK